MSTELPQMPNPYTGPDDMTINQFRVDTIKALQARIRALDEAWKAYNDAMNHGAELDEKFKVLDRLSTLRDQLTKEGVL